MKKLFVLVMSAMMIFAMSSAAFASTDNPQSTPVKLIATTTALDFTVSEAVTITANANSVNATVTDYKIKNNNEASFITVSNINLTAETEPGWEKVAYNEDAFKAYARDAKKFALQAKVGAAGTPTDLFSDWTTAGTISHGETMTIELSGLVSLVSTDVSNAQIARLVATVTA